MLQRRGLARPASVRSSTRQSGCPPPAWTRSGRCTSDCWPRSVMVPLIFTPVTVTPPEAVQPVAEPLILVVSVLGGGTRHGESRGEAGRRGDAGALHGRVRGVDLRRRRCGGARTGGDHRHRHCDSCRNDKHLANHSDCSLVPPCRHGLEVRRRSPPDVCPTTGPQIPPTGGTGYNVRLPRTVTGLAAGPSPVAANSVPSNRRPPMPPYTADHDPTPHPPTAATF